MNFAGRWTGEIFQTPEQKTLAITGDLDLDEVPNYLCFANDPDLAMEVINIFIGYRENHIKEARNTILKDYAHIDLMSLEYDPYKEPDWRTTQMGLYYYAELISILKDKWSPESAIYDLHAWSANLGEFVKRTQTAPEKQFLIPVDFHH